MKLPLAIKSKKCNTFAETELNAGFGNERIKMELTDAQRINLEWLHRQGGSGYLDRYGRLVAGGETKDQGCWSTWLRLVAWGLVSGSEGRLALTDKGREQAVPNWK
jgi:hypothetical protein